MSFSYEYSVGSVRAKEKSLLNSTDVEQLLACKNEGELCDMLRDKGYGDGNSVDEILSDRTDKAWEYLRTTAPDFEIFTPFLIGNDIHNLKVVLKG